MSASLLCGKSFFYEFFMLNEELMHLVVLLYSIRVIAKYNKILREMLSFQFLFNQRAVQHQVLKFAVFFVQTVFLSRVLF